MWGGGGGDEKISIPPEAVHADAHAHAEVYEMLNNTHEPVHLLMTAFWTKMGK